MASRALRAATALALAGTLGGCLHFGGKAPDQLYTFTAARQAPAGAASSGTATSALAVLEPGTGQRLNVTRIPVQVDPATVAYIPDATWVEKPSRLFQRLVSETIRARGTRLVVGENDLQFAAATKLTGQLADFGYDAASGSVVVRYDAVLQTPDGQIPHTPVREQVPDIAATGGAVAAALNQAANQIAGEVADWVG